MLKYKIYLFVFFLFGLCGYGIVTAQTSTLPLFGKVIYLDAGHGGSDPGALYKNIYEKDINLKIVQKLEEDLTQLGATVYLTRYGDYDVSVPNTINHKRNDLSRRGNMINKSGCDLYLSIHLNAETSSSWHGAEAYYDDVHPDNEKIAKIMQEEFKEHLYSKRKYKKTSSFYLNKRIERPGVLLEVGFLSNPNERYLLKTDSYQQKVSKTITGGVLRYFNDKKVFGILR